MFTPHPGDDAQRQVDANGKMPAMNRTPCLNAYHRAYCKRMKQSAVRRSKQPLMLPAEFIQQVSRLRRGSRPLPSAS